MPRCWNLALLYVATACSDPDCGELSRADRHFEATVQNGVYEGECAYDVHVEPAAERASIRLDCVAVESDCSCTAARDDFLPEWEPDEYQVILRPSSGARELAQETVSVETTCNETVAVTFSQPPIEDFLIPFCLEANSQASRCQRDDIINGECLTFRTSSNSDFEDEACTFECFAQADCEAYEETFCTEPSKAESSLLQCVADCLELTEDDRDTYRQVAAEWCK